MLTPEWRTRPAGGEISQHPPDRSRVHERLRAVQHVHDRQETASYFVVNGCRGYYRVDVSLENAVDEPQLAPRRRWQAQVLARGQVPGRAHHLDERPLRAAREALTPPGAVPLRIDPLHEGERAQDTGAHALSVHRIEAAHRVADGDEPLGPVGDLVETPPAVRGAPVADDGREWRRMLQDVGEDRAAQLLHERAEARFVRRRRRITVTKERQVPAIALDRKQDAAAPYVGERRLNVRGAPPRKRRARHRVEPAGVGHLRVDDLSRTCDRPIPTSHSGAATRGRSHRRPGRHAVRRRRVCRSLAASRTWTPTTRARLRRSEPGTETPSSSVTFGSGSALRPRMTIRSGPASRNTGNSRIERTPHPPGVSQATSRPTSTSCAPRSDHFVDETGKGALELRRASREQRVHVPDLRYAGAGRGLAGR